MTFTPEQIANGKTWIAALRSGDYRQGKYALEIEDVNGVFYCCLGVAHEMLGIPRNGPHHEYLRSDEASSILGITVEDQNRFAGMNDSGCSFPYIADQLEEFYGLTENAV